ncbi:hypothetical protein IGK68_001682 [Enterococcus sp. AZ166]|nr:hypothetical protein OIA_03803 [Enterococcus faecium EnGen0018]OTO75238.1 hypothetical protein A5837_001810 [Enterococcus faecium]OTO82086.1 hypothetical protein A5858_001651 [Enterococcus faecium]VTQ50205.1 Uncharacterised protein [Enterococcus faecium]
MLSKSNRKYCFMFLGLLIGLVYSIFLIFT